MSDDIKGLNKLLKDLDKLPEEIRKGVDDATFANAKQIERNAKTKAPINKDKHGGTLRQSIQTHETGTKTEIEYSIFALADYAAYMEFGTGGLVEVPKALKKLALKFKGKGIRKVNIKPQPFLYPSLLWQTKPYIDSLKQVLERNVGKI
jgi:HK97 gp10 family phage protein